MQAEIARLNTRITRLLEANNEELERRRDVERKLLESQWDAETWRKQWHEMRTLAERYEAELTEHESRQQYERLPK